MSAALTIAQAKVQGPSIDWAGLSPLLALLGGATLVLLLGLFRSRVAREALVPVLAIASFGAAIDRHGTTVSRATRERSRPVSRTITAPPSSASSGESAAQSMCGPFIAPPPRWS